RPHPRRAAGRRPGGRRRAARGVPVRRPPRRLRPARRHQPDHHPLGDVPLIALFAVTDAGRRAAAELAPALDARLHRLDELPDLWPRLDAAVFFLATGAAVRLIAPLLADKRTDPGVVCVDEA